ncbi:MAG: PorP/SprF family type IX secretion system membrane protein, partial [Bacteroidales bacterium]
MIKLKKIFLTIFILASAGITAYSQDPHFSQFYANPLYLNPAFAGSSVCPRLILNFRDQWPNIPGTFVSYSASYDRYVDNLSGGLGLIATADNAGDGTLNTEMISAIYSYHLKVSRTFSINAGFQA